MARTLAAWVLLASALGACSTGAEAPVASQGAASPAERTASATKRSEGGRVTVEATWSGPEAGATFELTLDTHTVDLDALDLADAILRNDRGATLRARPWTAPMGGHHRTGQLAFDGDATRFFVGARWIELVVKGVGDLPVRTLRWEVGA